VSTLIVSDFHLGARLGRDVLRHPEALERLLAALDGVSRLVLLGDVVELLEGRPDRSMPIAGPVLKAIGQRVGRDGEIIVVPGNHDRALVRPWFREHGVPSEVEAEIPLDATRHLEILTGWLAPARVSVRYPGVWLSERVWATHGHYLDRHLVPEVAYGIGRGELARVPREGALPLDYERHGGPSLTRVEALMTRWLPRPLALLSEDAAELMRAVTMPRIPRRAVTHRFSWLNALLLGEQMRRASIPALARVVRALGVEADWVVFGHVHRLGPLARDDVRRWSGPDGAPRIANTGSWIYEPLLLHHVTPPHPYWPGGAIVLPDGGEPRAVGLLDELGAASLRPS
jgi:UDP-2,3-diacylglucosamine pyrophosphatase LpxH